MTDGMGWWVIVVLIAGLAFTMSAVVCHVGPFAPEMGGKNVELAPVQSPPPRISGGARYLLDPNYQRYQPASD